MSNPTNMINTINKAVPICFSGFAVALSAKAGIFNIGVEGQLVFGALGSAIAGAYVTGLPAFLHVPLALFAGMLFGVLYALIPALLHVYRKINLLVVSLLMNNIAAFLITYCVVGPFAGSNPQVAATPRIQSAAELPYLITQPNKLTIGIMIALLAAFIISIFMNKTTKGYQLRVCGDNPEAARFAGINVQSCQMGALMISGALAGLAGGVEVLGTFHRLYDGFSPGYGFDGIPIAMLAGGNPYGVFIGSLLFGALRVGSISMQSKAGVASQIVSVIQGALVTLIAAQYILRFVLDKMFPGKQKAERQQNG
jgi:simple sugar transport system permease protein